MTPEEEKVKAQKASRGAIDGLSLTLTKAIKSVNGPSPSPQEEH